MNYGEAGLGTGFTHGTPRPAHPWWLGGTEYYGINVLTVVNCLDLEKSDILYSSEDPDYILMISRYVFEAELVPSEPIFKVLPTDNVFVKPDVVKVIIESGLTNAYLTDPSVNSLQRIAQGLDINVVDGLK